MIQRLPGLLAHNVSLYSSVMLRHKHFPALLPRVLQSCLLHLSRSRPDMTSAVDWALKANYLSFYLSRIDSLAASRAGTKPHQALVVSPTSVRHFSNSSSCARAAKKPTASRQSRFGSGEEPCQVFDQSEMLVGRMTIQAAEELAKKDNLKLVDMGQNSDGLRSFLLLSGRELAEESKRQRTERKSERVKEREKEFRVTSNITDHDLDIKVGQARNVLTRGGPVKFVIKAHRRSAQVIMF